ncbi:hypothetical protein BJ165DRAFT_1525762 [Panaeolus papilionaceus]|nr:hypothetical protein BJ165DRAFT_1525762 [Panaeolus papilionaceus]
MYSTATRSLLCFTAIALLSSPNVLARPVQNTNDHVQGPAHSLSARSDAELLGELLFRRTRSRSSSASSASSHKSHMIEVCHPAVKKRSLEALLYARTASDSGGTSDEDEKRISDLDPQGTMVVAAPPTTYGERMGEGSQARVYRDPTNPDLLIKHFNVEFSSFSPGNLYKEKKYLEKVKHYGGKFHYMVKPPSKAGRQPQLTQAWLWVKLVPGVGLSKLGLFPLPHNTDDKKEVSEFAKNHPVGSEKRKAFIEKLITMVTTKALEYAKDLGVRHLDVSEANVRIVMTGEEITSVDLIDWGMAGTTNCSPETEANLRKAVRDAFKIYLEV